MCEMTIVIFVSTISSAMSLLTKRYLIAKIMH